jgi:hypothetical protein
MLKSRLIGCLTLAAAAALTACAGTGASPLPSFSTSTQGVPYHGGGNKSAQLKPEGVPWHLPHL